ncbi:MAG TPA: translocation/assembly module TamB domain-containing protein, partial [Paenirhodobacter sp.]
LRDGGTVSVSGPITLSGGYPADLRIALNGAHLRDPQLYDTRISGGLTVSGPLTGGGTIGGTLTLDETEIRVPSGGLGGAAEIPDITHLREGRASLITRGRAGLTEGDTQAGGSSSGQGFRLNVTVNAPRAIFVRGRGLDAELGGSIRLTGTTNNIIPVGHFSLVRGRLDILAKRFDLTDGNVALQGAMVPWIQFVATTNQDDVAITLTLEGNATEPTLTIASSPELPEEEVLARLLFNKGLSNLSALQAAQLASSIASLAGKGGAGIMARLRQSFGLDDLDVGTDADGNATVKAGKYLSSKVYTDVAIDGTGETTLNLNLDVTKNITARGSVGSAGDSGAGVFFEKDY